MLPPELTRARKREGKLTLSPLSPAERVRAEELCRALLSITQASLGRAREDVEAGWAAVEVAPKERKLLLGLTHLVEQKSEFTAPSSAEPDVVRRALFERAAERRAALAEGEHLDRERLVAEVAAELGLSPEQLEQALYADLRGAQRLQRCTSSSAAATVSEYELLQVQSVLLRAVSVEAEVRAAKPDAYRALFHKLKFRQLLHRIEPLEGGGYRLHIDGPMSLFGPTTKYGLELALSLPALLQCGSVRLKAELRWGKRREKLRFEQLYAQAPELEADGVGVRSEVLELCEAIGVTKSGFQARLSGDLLLLDEGGGVLVPDLELSHPERSGSVLVELLGFWSRDAVFRRIEAVQRLSRALGAEAPRVLFAASSRLRVSEELLEGEPAASLYVYKGKINTHALLRKVDELLLHGNPRQAPAR